MTTPTPKPQRKRIENASRIDDSNLLREAAKVIGNSYFRHAVAVVENSIGPVHRFNATQAVAGCVQAYATIHAAELIAGALNRNTMALKALAKSRPD